jgi:hypothetical protein
VRSGYIQREEKRESAVTTSPRVFQDDQNDLRVLELGTLGQMVVTVSLSLRTVSSTDSRSYHTAAVSEEGPKVAIAMPVNTQSLFYLWTLGELLTGMVNICYHT